MTGNQSSSTGAAATLEEVAATEPATSVAVGVGGGTAPIFIVGAGAAGFRCAEAFRREGGAGRVILLGDEDHLPYDRPELSKRVLQGEQDASATNLTTAGNLAELGIEYLAGARATRIDLDARTIEYVESTQRSEAACFDRVVFATGGRPRLPDIEGINLDGVWTFRTIEDAIGIRLVFDHKPRVVVIGAGFVGTEVAAVARSHGAEVVVVDPAPRPVPALPRQVSDAVRAVHEERGVRFEFGSTVTALTGASHVEGVVLDDERFLPADIVVVGVGITPNDELASSAGVETDDGVLVDDRWQSSDRRLLAIGDVARRRAGFMGERARHEHWRTAHDSGTAAGRYLATGQVTAAAAPWFWTEQFEMNVHVVGSPTPEDEVLVRPGKTNGSFTTFHRRNGMWRAVVAVNDPLNVRIGQSLLGTNWEAEGDLVDTSTELRKVIAAAQRAAS